MANTPHELTEEFPAEAQKIHALKAENAHFAKLVEDYHEVNRAVHAAETRVTPMDEETEEGLRRRRVALKDEIRRMLQAA
ncbi:MAG: DUF465 domain-containing protein [Paracoccaceae bacterium]|nr:DUF465 domain-containing protein [Paracoccaceae bacterium]MDE3122118.1 DUF465 domain-containing protein [Paracoccaceae bacterium]MDE3239896.1 DUF465 domain-containing protein [Paracoccaceae bacterium]